MVISQPPPTAGGMTVPPPSMLGGNLQKPPPNMPPPSHLMTSVGGHQHQLAVPAAQAQGTPIIGPDGQIIDYDGKRLRKTMMRKTIDYNSSFVNMIQNRIWQRDHRDRRAIQPDITYYPSIEPPQVYRDHPVNAVSTRFIKTATNKMRCPIFCLSWTPEGRRLITGASSGEFTLWNGLTFNFETILQAHDSPVRAMKWSHNSSWMVTGDHGGYIKYWQSNMNNVKMFQAHKEPVRQVAFSPMDSKFASCSDDGTVRIWDFQKCIEERVLRGHGSDVKCVDWHPQKGLVVSGSKDNQQPLKLWDPRTGSVLSTIHAHKSTVMDCSWNQNGNWLITASRDHLLKLFDIRNMKEEMQMFRGHKKEASAVAWHPVHESLFSSGGSDGAIIFWNVNQDKEIGVIEGGHESIVWTLVWHPVGHILTTGSNDHTVKFWSRNRPGDTMRDKYNTSILHPPVEEDNGNLIDLARGSGEQSQTLSGSTVIPGIKQESKLVIPGLDVQAEPEDVKPVIVPGKPAFSKPAGKDLEAVNSWKEAVKSEDQRGTKRLFGEREVPSQPNLTKQPPPAKSLELPQPRTAATHLPPPVAAQQPPAAAMQQQQQMSAGSKAITLSQLQQEATAVVAQGQIIPVLPGSALFHAVAAGEMAIRDVLIRDFNIGSRGSSLPGPGAGPGPPNFSQQNDFSQQRSSYNQPPPGQNPPGGGPPPGGMMYHGGSSNVGGHHGGPPALMGHHGGRDPPPHHGGRDSQPHHGGGPSHVGGHGGHPQGGGYDRHHGDRGGQQGYGGGGGDRGYGGDDRGGGQQRFEGGGDRSSSQRYGGGGDRNSSQRYDGGGDRSSSQRYDGGGGGGGQNWGGGRDRDRDRDDGFGRGSWGRGGGRNRGGRN